MPQMIPGLVSSLVIDEYLPYAEEIEDLPLADEYPEDPGLFLLAPETSHVQAMRFLDNAEQPEIQVRFKAKGNQPVRQYRYIFSPSERERAQIIFEEMAPATHPGIVIWEWLIRPGVRYEEMAVE